MIRFAARLAANRWGSKIVSGRIALRHAVIARRISFGTRTDEGSRFYAAGLSVIETCRKRGVDAWNYARDLITTARAELPHPPIPAGA